MTTEIAVLRALLRFSRRRAPATLHDLAARVGHDAGDVERALHSLARAGLAQRSGETARLSLSGLAVAVAVTASVRANAASRPRQAPSMLGAARSSARVFPIVRRRRAA